jgi:hypothetical protein
MAIPDPQRDKAAALPVYQEQFLTLATVFVRP